MMSVRYNFLMLMISVAGFAGTVRAEESSLPDPTRPPPDAVSSAAPTGTAGTAGAAGASGATASASGDTAAQAAASGLTSIFLRKGARPAAIINGQYVELGGKVGERKVVRITEGEVALAGAEGQEVLRLTPGIEKKLIVEKEPVIKKKPIKRKTARKAETHRESRP